MYIYNLNAVTATGCSICTEKKCEILRLKRIFDEKMGDCYDTSDYFGTWDYLTDLVGFVSEEMGIDEMKVSDYLNNI